MRTLSLCARHQINVSYTRNILYIYTFHHLPSRFIPTLYSFIDDNQMAYSVAENDEEEEGTVGYTLPASSSNNQHYLLTVSQAYEPRAAANQNPTVAVAGPSRSITSTSGQFFTLVSPPLNQLPSSTSVPFVAAQTATSSTRTTATGTTATGT